jgi:hypothetical protein
VLPLTLYKGPFKSLSLSSLYYFCLVLRFGHASATSGDVLVFGGYGSDGIRHARLSCPILLRFGKTAGLVTS